jgi:hypothetical protein
MTSQFLLAFAWSTTLLSPADHNVFARRFFNLPQNWRFEDQPSFKVSSLREDVDEYSVLTGPFSWIQIEKEHLGQGRIVSARNSKPKAAVARNLSTADLQQSCRELLTLAGHRTENLSFSVRRDLYTLADQTQTDSAIFVSINKTHAGFAESAEGQSTVVFSPDGMSLYRAYFADKPIRCIPPFDVKITEEAALLTALTRLRAELGSSILTEVTPREPVQWSWGYAKDSSEPVLATDRFKPYLNDPSAAALTYWFSFSATLSVPKPFEPHGWGVVEVEAYSGKITRCSYGWFEPQRGLSSSSSTVKPALRPFALVRGQWLIGKQPVVLSGVSTSPVAAKDWKSILLTSDKTYALVEFSPSKQVLRERWKKEWKYQKLSRATVKALLAKPAR